jgi:hypothetical protein
MVSLCVGFWYIVKFSLLFSLRMVTPKMLIKFSDFFSVVNSMAGCNQMNLIRVCSIFVLL